MLFALSSHKKALQGPQEDAFTNTWAGENDLRREDVSQFGKDTLFQWVLHTLKLIICDVMLGLMVKVFLSRLQIFTLALQ